MVDTMLGLRVGRNDGLRVGRDDGTTVAPGRST